MNQVSERIMAAHRLLLEVRSRRPRPGIDDKVVTAWNGMMVLALARASHALEEPRYRTAAESAARYLESHLYDVKTQRLRRSYRADAPAGQAVLDDYADLIGGLMELYQSGFDVHWLQEAVRLQEEQDELFWDSERAGYFDALASDTALLARTREQYDGAEPSPNATAAMNLLRLAEITGRESWRTKARQTIKAFGARLESQPEDVPALASALDFDLAPIRHIVIAGDPLSRDTGELLRLVNDRFLPNVVLLLADGGPGQEQLARWLPFLAGAHPIGGKATAYICDNLVCKLPSADPKVVARLLDAGPPITSGER